jgi:hypothetical protein
MAEFGKRAVGGVVDVVQDSFVKIDAAEGSIPSGTPKISIP